MHSRLVSRMYVPSAAIVPQTIPRTIGITARPELRIF